MKKAVLLTTLIIGLIVTAMIAAAYAQTMQIQIGYPNSSNDLGIDSSSGLTNAYWVGQFPVTINYGTSTPTTGEVYCMNANGQVIVGGNYNAAMTPVPNDPTWQQIGYILSWYAPAGTDQAAHVQAAVDQVAIWMLLNQQPLPSTSPGCFNKDSRPKHSEHSNGKRRPQCGSRRRPTTMDQPIHRSERQRQLHFRKSRSTSHFHIETHGLTRATQYLTHKSTLPQPSHLQANHSYTAISTKHKQPLGIHGQSRNGASYLNRT